MKIIIEKEKCIGCGSCAALCPKFFEMAEDGKSHLKGSKFDPKTEKEELEIKEPSCAKEAAEVCPVQIIKIHES
ncbi:ferredoxin [Patescibacteria group bacterium]|nr:ferredoxin [Patescibacteria group bacterium]